MTFGLRNWQKITPRLVLQEFGTDCMRKGFYDGVWVSMIKNKLIQNPHKNYVIPDVRFPNEGTMILHLGGKFGELDEVRSYVVTYI